VLARAEVGSDFVSSDSAFRRSVGALGHRNFRLYFSGQLLSTVGTWMQVTAQVWLVVDITKSGGAVGITAALQFLPALLISPYAGLIADRFDNRKLLLTTNSLAGLFALGLGTLSAFGLLSVGWLYVGAFAIGMSNAFDRATGPAFVSSMVPREQLTSAVSLYSVTAAASRMVGIAISGVIIAAWGATSCFMLNAASYLIVLASLLLLRQSELTPRLRSGAVRIRDGLRHVRERPLVMRSIVVTTILGVCCMNFLTLVPSVIKLDFGAGATAFGVAEVFSGGGSTVAGFVVAGLHRRPDGRTLAISVLLFGAGSLATGLSPSLVAFCVLMFSIGFTTAAFQTITTMIGQLESEPSMRGRVASLQAMAQQGTLPLGALLAGALIPIIGSRAVFLFDGVVAVAVGAGLLVLELTDRAPTHEPIEVDMVAVPEVGDVGRTQTVALD
jgi:MFS family permease